jgi:hypothetical protein
MHSNQQDLDSVFVKIRDDIQAKDQAVDSIFEQLERLLAQAAVQKRLLSTARILSSYHGKKALPNQLASRVRHILNLVYGGSPQNNGARNKERSGRLQKLECNALKFCGLAYTVRNLLELPNMQFEHLIEYVTEFISIREITPHLHRRDIEMAISSIEVVEDKQLFRDFLNGEFYKILSVVADIISES